MLNLLKTDQGFRASILFIQRLNYIVNARPSDMSGKPYVDHKNFEFILYGRVDQNLFPRIINPDFLKPIKSGTTKSNKSRPIRLVKPAADAANDFLKEYESAYYQNKISKDDKFLTALKPVKGYISLYEQYNNYARQLFGVFMNDYLPHALKNYDGLKSFGDFVSAFVEFATKYKAIKIIPSTFILSRSCDPFVSGLMISFADLKANNDKQKYDDFIKSPNSNFFRRMAIKYGFKIDINMPWVLIADLASPGMAPYMEKYLQENSVSNFFNNFYNIAYFKDLELLQNQLVRFYNQFVDQNPRYIKVDENSRGNINISTQRRTKIKSEILFEKYSDEFWVKTYIDLKANEFPAGTIEDAKIREIKNKAISLLQNFSLFQAEYYVNIEMQQYYALANGSFYRHLKDKESEESEDVLRGATSPSAAFGTTTSGGSGGSGY